MQIGTPGKRLRIRHTARFADLIPAWHESLDDLDYTRKTFKIPKEGVKQCIRDEL